MIIDFIIYLLIGAFAGGMAGLLGVGGGIIVVPALAFVYTAQSFPHDTLMHSVAGTSLAAMIATTLFSMRAHYHRGAQIWPIAKKLLPGMIIGTIAGTILARFLHSTVLSLIFGIFVLVISLRMFFPDRKKETEYPTLPRPAGNWSITLFIGVMSGLIGIGGSTLAIPYLTYCNVLIRTAMAVSTACGLAISITGTIAFIITGWHAPHLPPWSTGYVYWPAVIGIALTSPWFATLGAILSHRLDVKILRRIFAIFLLVVGIRMLIY